MLSCLVRDLGLHLETFVNWVTFGWLETSKQIRCKVLDFIDCGTSGGGRELHKAAQVIKCQQLLIACLAVAIKQVPRPYCQTSSQSITLAKIPWSKYLGWTLVRAAQHFFNLLGYGFKLPLVRCSTSLRDKIFLAKRKSKLRPEEACALSVQSPSQQKNSSDKFVHVQAASAQDQALLQALTSCAPDVPCGNPFNSLLAVLSFRSTISAQWSVLPTTPETCHSPVLQLYNKIVAHNVLSAVICLPILHRQLGETAANYPASKIPQAILCRECGYCLNFGRGKFTKVHFNPTQAFYCRDQKEKQLTVCATTGRVYCSYCGSSWLKVHPLAGINIIRAVVANNATLMISDSKQEVDVIVPCLSSKHCSSCLLKKVSIKNLVYLTAVKTNFVCHKCAEAD